MDVLSLPDVPFFADVLFMPDLATFNAAAAISLAPRERL
jgi:hypothetical protein